MCAVPNNDLYKNFYHKYLLNQFTKIPKEAWLDQYCTAGLIVRGLYNGEWYNLYRQGPEIPRNFKPFELFEAETCAFKEQSLTYEDVVYAVFQKSLRRVIDNYNGCIC